MKILHVTHTYLPDKGGSQVYIHDILKSDESDLKRILAFTNNYHKSNNFLKLFKFNSVTGIIINNFKIFYYVCKESINCIHIHNAFVDYLQIILLVKINKYLKKQKVSIILTSHGGDFAPLVVPQYEIKYSFIKKLILRSCFRSCGCIIAISKSMNDILFDLNNKWNCNTYIKYIPNYIPLNSLNYDSNNKNNFDNCIRISSLSGHRPVKGHNFMTQCLITISLKHPNKIFKWYIGGGTTFKIKAKLPKNLKVKYLNYLDQNEKNELFKNRYLHKWGFFEPFGLLIYESILSGTVVLAGSKSGCRI